MNRAYVVDVGRVGSGQRGDSETERRPSGRIIGNGQAQTQRTNGDDAVHIGVVGGVGRGWPQGNLGWLHPNG